jgi:hypothetical protein
MVSAGGLWLVTRIDFLIPAGPPPAIIHPQHPDPKKTSMVKRALVNKAFTFMFIPFHMSIATFFII